MEGLIPFVYRSLKKSKTRRKYECLSSGAAQSYDVANFYVKDDIHHHEYSSRSSISTSDDVPGRHGAHHRRYNSVVVDDRRGGGFALGGGGGGSPKPNQLVRFRSHRVLSCITGA